MSVRSLRAGAVLLPAALLLHELAYLSVDGGLIGAHHYLEALVPLTAALAASMALGAVVMPALGARGSAAHPAPPFALAAALLGIFAVQELAEATLLGGGLRGLEASLQVAWLAPPLALALGAICSAVIAALERAGKHLAVCSTRRLPPAPRTRRAPRPCAGPSLDAKACEGLSFGFARRPPPALRWS